MGRWADVVKLGRVVHVTSQQAFIASSVWAGIGLMATVHLFTQHFFRWTGSRSYRLRWLALVLLMVTGADLIPALGNVVLQALLNGDIEWWSMAPVDSGANSLLWVPYHVAGTLCCLLVFCFLWPVILSNDFGYRAVMLPQFFLVLLTAEWLGAW